MMIYIIKKYVQEACSKEYHLFGTAIFDYHILVVLDDANQLVALLHANKEVVLYE